MSRPPAFPLRVSANERHLEDASGTPFYFAGDTHWPLFWHYTLEEAREILDDRAARGFSAILVQVSHDNSENRDGHAPFLDRRTLEVDEAYFAQADRVLEHAASKGLAVYAAVYWWRHQARYASEERLYAYGHWLGKRWQHRSNLLWVLGGDLRFRPADLPRFRALARGIREGGAAQLMSWHPYHGPPWTNDGHSSSEYLHDESWHDFSSVQARAQGGRMVDCMLRDYNRRPTKPTILVETWYFWNRLWRRIPIHRPAPQIRHSHYQARLGGGSFGEGYGAYPFSAWDSTPDAWRRALTDQPSATQIATHMRRCLEALDWWRLEPDQSGEILVGGRGSGRGWDRAVAAGDAEHSGAVVYLPTHREIRLDFGWFDREVEARWYDPTDGSSSEVPVPPRASVQTLVPPHRNRAGDEDFALVLSRPR